MSRYKYSASMLGGSFRRRLRLDLELAMRPWHALRNIWSRFSIIVTCGEQRVGLSPTQQQNKRLSGVMVRLVVLRIISCIVLCCLLSMVIRLISDAIQFR